MKRLVTAWPRRSTSAGPIKLFVYGELVLWERALVQPGLITKGFELFTKAH